MLEKGVEGLLEYVVVEKGASIYPPKLLLRSIGGGAKEPNPGLPAKGAGVSEGRVTRRLRPSPSSGSCLRSGHKKGNIIL